MANYTMTIMEMMNNNLTKNIFPNHYDFYIDDEQARKSFEDKFIKHYYYREIGFETPFMFTHKLETHLLINMPYWKQLYETELEARNINFLLNKDLRETFIREVETENNMMANSTSNQNNQTTSSMDSSQNSTGTSTATQNDTSTSTQSGTSKQSLESTSTTEQTDSQQSTTKESLIRDGVAQASLTDDYLTGANSTNVTNTQNVSGTTDTTTEQTNSTEANSTSESNLTNQQTSQIKASGNNATYDEMKANNKSSQQDNGTTLEKTDLISQGNIGITSSAQLLKEWREVLINMDKIIIDSCNDLFMKIY